VFAPGESDKCAMRMNTSAPERTPVRGYTVGADYPKVVLQKRAIHPPIFRRGMNGLPAVTDSTR
jgi:hypothetical protein